MQITAGELKLPGEYLHLVPLASKPHPHTDMSSLTELTNSLLAQLVNSRGQASLLEIQTLTFFN